MQAVDIIYGCQSENMHYIAVSGISQYILVYCDMWFISWHILVNTGIILNLCQVILSGCQDFLWRSNLTAHMYQAVYIICWCQHLPQYFSSSSVKDLARIQNHQHQFLLYILRQVRKLRQISKLSRRNPSWILYWFKVPTHTCILCLTL
jgi:hypothetical protein